MKAILIHIIFIFFLSKGYSQIVDIMDSGIAYTFRPINISYSPSDFISKISVVKKKFASGRPGIQFSLKAKRKEQPFEIRIDSIIMQSIAKNILTINKPYRDTIYFSRDGGLLLTIIHYLDKNDLDFLKKETVKKIVLTVDSKPLVIILTKKSRRVLKEFMN